MHLVSITSDLEQRGAIARRIACFVCAFCALRSARFCKVCVGVLGVCLAVSACATAGRADYFGNLPNLAARVMALAAPGQVLLEGFQGFGPEVVHKDELTAMLPQQPSNVQGASDYEAVEVLQLGKYPIKASLYPGPLGLEYIGLLYAYKPHPFTSPPPPLPRAKLLCLEEKMGPLGVSIGVIFLVAYR